MTIPSRRPFTSSKTSKKSPETSRAGRNRVAISHPSRAGMRSGRKPDWMPCAMLSSRWYSVRLAVLPVASTETASFPRSAHGIIRLRSNAGRYGGMT